MACGKIPRSRPRLLDSNAHWQIILKCHRRWPRIKRKAVKLSFSIVVSPVESISKRPRCNGYGGLKGFKMAKLEMKKIQCEDLFIKAEGKFYPVLSSLFWKINSRLPTMVY